MRNFKKLISLLLGFTSVLCLNAQEETSGRIELSLEDVLDYAKANNLQIQNARLDLKASRLQKDEAFCEYLPKVNAMALGFYAMNPLLELGITDILGDNDFSWQLQEKAQELSGVYGFNTKYTAFKNGYSTSISLMQPLYAGGRIVNGNKLASIGVEASQLQLSLQERKTSEEIEKDWWQIASLEEQIENLKYLDGSLETIYRQLQEAVGSGLSSQSELLQLEVKRKELKAGLKKAESGVRLLKLNLLSNIGLKGLQLDSVSFKKTPLEPESPEYYYRDPERIIGNMEESRLLELQVRAKQMEKKMSIGESLPQVAVGATAGYSDFYDKTKFNTIAFATIQIPLSDWIKTSKKAQRIQTEVQKAENEREYLQRQLHLLVDKLYLELSSAYDQWQVKEELQNSCQRLYEMALSNYTAGLIPLQEVLQAESQYHNASAECTEALVEYRNSIIAYTSLLKD